MVNVDMITKKENDLFGTYFILKKVSYARTNLGMHPNWDMLHL